ncbi:MAG: RICIN domain-containing protein, partial [Ruminococcus sp.]|nr:RICIN domain-containing protein [Ruminococcus sp.]
ELQSFTGSDNQLWKLIQNGNYYGIVSKCSGDKSGFDVFDWSTENGGNINQWEYWGGDCQLWKITPVYPMVNNGKYTLRNVNSGLYVSDKSNNAVQSSAHKWTIKSTGDGAYTIQSEDGKALTVEKGSSENGANVSLETYTGNSSQKFMLKTNKDGSYSLMSVVSGGKSCVDVYEISMADGANLNQWEYWGGDGQKFVIEPSSTEKKTVIGDVNADGDFNISDLIMMQKFLLGNGTLTDWKTGDLCKDEKIDVFDMIMMRKLIIK